MDPNKSDINEEQFTGNELDEVQSDEKFSGNELDEVQSDEQFAGNELDETQSDENFSGNELDETLSDENFSGSELDEIQSNGSLTGNELDNSKADIQKIQAEAEKPDSIIDKEPLDNSSSKRKKILFSVDAILSLFKIKKITIVHKISAIVIMLCFITTTLYFFIIRQPQVENKPIPIEKTSVRNDNYALVFDTFIVPFEQNKYYTYMLLDISFDIQEKKLREEMTGKQNKLRKIIYDKMLDKIKGVKSLPPVAEIKNDIKSAINTVLENGRIQEVFITKYHAL
ncbi:MAG: hypothetical protein KKC46_03480 [Proteobacteria bacterium]|nr:hypothetical protein [Pseudomonadota bacterium]